MKDPYILYINFFFWLRQELRESVCLPKLVQITESLSISHRSVLDMSQVSYTYFIGRTEPKIVRLVNCEWPETIWRMIHNDNLINFLCRVSQPDSQEMIPISYCNNPEWPISNIFSPNASSFSRIYFSTTARNKTEIGFQRHTKKKEEFYYRKFHAPVFFKQPTNIQDWFIALLPPRDINGISELTFIQLIL